MRFGPYVGSRTGLGHSPRIASRAWVLKKPPKFAGR